MPDDVPDLSPWDPERPAVRYGALAWHLATRVALCIVKIWAVIVAGLLLGIVWTVLGRRP